MASMVSHPLVPLAVSQWFPAGSLSPRVVALGMLCSVLPDLDVIGFAFGVRYGDLFGHRGFTGTAPGSTGPAVCAGPGPGG